MKNQSAYPLLDTLKKLGLKPTRENYLAIDGWDNPNRALTAEEEMELPPQFRRQPSRPPKKVPAKKREAPEVTVTVTYTRPVLTLEQQVADDWKLENWPRCEHEDFFDMCLACITHRQANDLVN